ncbi:MAG TPA: ribosome maturation factor RimM [Limnobacter sp.]|nr:ribosome maturation factor RimM [Limnobacter sp.]
MNAPDDLVELGRIGEPYGLKGWLNVSPSSDDPQVLLKSKQWWISRIREEEGAAVRKPGKPAPEDLVFEPFRVLQAKPHSNRIVAHLEGIEQPELAARFKGRRVYVSRARFPATEQDEYYWVDLQGCTVVNQQGYTLGVVTEVVDHGAHPILVVKGSAEEDMLIPFVAAYVLNVDVKGRLIQADWQEDY